MTFGAQLRVSRKATGITLSALAAHLDCSVAFLSDVELGRRRALNSEQIVEACKLLRIPPTTLLRAATNEGRGILVRTQNNGVMEIAMALVGTQLDRPEIDAMLDVLRAKGIFC